MVRLRAVRGARGWSGDLLLHVVLLVQSVVRESVVVLAGEALLWQEWWSWWRSGRFGYAGVGRWHCLLFASVLVAGDVLQVAARWRLSWLVRVGSSLAVLVVRVSGRLGRIPSGLPCMSLPMVVLCSRWCMG